LDYTEMGWWIITANEWEDSCNELSSHFVTFRHIYTDAGRKIMKNPVITCVLVEIRIRYLPNREQLPRNITIKILDIIHHNAFISNTNFWGLNSVPVFSWNLFSRDQYIEIVSVSRRKHHLKT
jgi:hypothetical protein